MGETVAVIDKSGKVVSTVRKQSIIPLLFCRQLNASLTLYLYATRRASICLASSKKLAPPIENARPRSKPPSKRIKKSARLSGP